MTLIALLTRCRVLLAMLLAVTTVFAPPALALRPPATSTAKPDDDTIVYIVQPGDTLISLARLWMIRETDWQPVQRINRIADPHRLRIASRITIPIPLLKSRPASATVAAFRGQAQAAPARGALQAVTRGQVLAEGSTVVTGPASSLSLSLTDGSVITLPSNSALRIARLRKLLLTDSIDYELALDRGAVRSRVSPLRNTLDRFRLRNPIAVSAVRGTDFRSHYDATKGQAKAELIEGGLAITGPAMADETALDAKFGAIIGRAGDVDIQQLLQAPVLVAGGAMQKATALAFAISAVPGAASYRVQIARDSGFIDVVDDLASPATDFTLPPLANGNYFARFTAIAPSGLEGLPGTFAFKRRLATSIAGASPSEDGYVFRWVGSSEGARRYRFQLRAQGNPVLMVDEAGLANTSIIMSDLAPGRYQWRVGTTTYSPEDTETDWTDYESFTIDE